MLTRWFSSLFLRLLDLSVVMIQKNGNTGATTLTNYNELKNSCVNQNYTVSIVSMSFLPPPWY